MLRLFIADFKMMVRDRQRLFWSLAFPLMFVVIFGFFFGKGNTTAGTVALIDMANTQMAVNMEKALKDSDLFRIQETSDLSEARDLLNKNSIAAIIYVPKGFGDQGPNSPNKVKIIYDPANAQASSAAISFLNNYVTQSNFRLQNVKPYFGVETEKTNVRQLSYFDFIVVGLIGMALMNSSIQGVGIAMAKFREDKILKRVTTTPLKSWKFIVAEVLSRLILNIVQIALILVAGIYLFDAHIYGSIPLMFVFGLFGGILFQLMGFVVAAFSRTTQAAEGMATAITIPMMFLAGVFFPIDQLPKWLYSIVQYFPLAPLLKIIRDIGLEDASPFSDPTSIIIVGAWIIGLLIVASLRFRLSEEG